MSSIEDMIDRAIEDYAVSGDAMRWTPDEPPNPTGQWAQNTTGVGRLCTDRFIYRYWWLVTPPPRGRDFLLITGI
jgi:hypothetical protein